MEIWWLIGGDLVGVGRLFQQQGGEEEEEEEEQEIRRLQHLRDRKIERETDSEKDRPCR